MHNPPHPGEVLQDTVLADRRLSVSEFARKLGVSVALRGLLVNLRDMARRVAELRSALASQIDRVELDPETERCVIHYRRQPGLIWRPHGDSNLMRVV